LFLKGLENVKGTYETASHEIIALSIVAAAVIILLILFFKKGGGGCGNCGKTCFPVDKKMKK
jgi:hypothetical protein